MLQASKDIYTTKDMMYSLFCHECFRVYGDRMWDKQDKLWLQVRTAIRYCIDATAELPGPPMFVSNTMIAILSRIC